MKNEITIFPSKAIGTIKAYPSKSHAHRLIICSALSKGICTISNVKLSDDINATLGAICALGAKYKYENDELTIDGTNFLNVDSNILIDCNESASTLRFFIPLCLSLNKDVKFIGKEALISRPLTSYEEVSKLHGFKFDKSNTSVELKGNLTADTYEIAGNISSQFVSGFLFVLPTFKNDSKIVFTTDIESKPYIDFTIRTLFKYGVTVFWKNSNTIYIKGNQQYKAVNTVCEGDFTSSAIFEAFNYLGGKVNITGLDLKSPQGDKEYLTIYRKIASSTPSISIKDIPDLAPILITMGALFNGITLTETNRLKIKESNRAKTISEELAKFGADITILDNSIEVKKATLHKPTSLLNSHNDHRIVMALAVIATVYGGTIVDAEAISKSFPPFFEYLKSIQINLE